MSETRTSFPLRKFDDSTYKIKLDDNSKILLISDQHFSDDNESYFSDEAIKLTIHYFSKIIEKINPTKILILGDLIHGSMITGSIEFKKFSSTIFEILEKLNREVILISGNHDRNSYDNLDFSRFKYLKYLNNNFLEIIFNSLSVGKHLLFNNSFSKNFHKHILTFEGLTRANCNLALSSLQRQHSDQS